MHSPRSADAREVMQHMRLERATHVRTIQGLGMSELEQTLRQGSMEHIQKVGRKRSGKEQRAPRSCGTFAPEDSSLRAVNDEEELATA
ncbi:hypothetical protein RB195_009851 [Necator americanus]|uniref:Uncharacterized protein n=1 Tax=Necator americanus TaxID=51031 RepID=A0ABR1CWN6_NECAM